MKKWYLALIILFLLFVSPFKNAPAMEGAQDSYNGHGEPPHGTSPNGINMPAIVKLNDHILKIGDVMVHSQKRHVSINGEVNMKEGLVEYLACTPTGKLHESVLKLFADPSHIQIALLLLGLEPGNSPIPFQGAPEIPRGAPLDILVSWQVNGKEVVCKSGDLILNINSNKTAMNVNWVFTGSQVLEGKFMAREEGSIVAIFHDPSALIDHTNKSGADDTIFYANKNLLPPKGTRVKVRISGRLN